MRLIDITDFQDPALDVYARISEGQLLNRAEPEKGMFIAESPKVIRRALQAGYQPVSFLVENRLAESNHETRELLEEWEGMDIPIYTAEFDVLTQLTGFMLTRGMLCAMYRKPLPSMEEVCRGAKRIAVLENVVNPTNVGAIFRSAAALGMDAVLLTRAWKHCAEKKNWRLCLVQREKDCWIGRSQHVIILCGSPCSMAWIP